ncbi:MAG: ATP-binding protein [Bacillota bacterium]|nr:ATP-binding protein [Bacillota bacterium]
MKSTTCTKNFECPICEDREIVVEEREGEVWARECTCKPQKQINRMFKQSGMTEEQRKIKLEDYKISPQTKDMFKMVKNYIEHFKEIQESNILNKGLALIGAYGVGKTMLMCAIANHILSLKIPTMFVVGPDLIADLMSAQFDGGREVFDNKVKQLTTVQVLILDDIAKEKISEWVQTQYFRIIDARYRANLTTLFTSNFTFDQIEAKMGEAVGSRLFGLTRDHQVIVNAPNYRISGKYEKLYL